jgi:hypothetical protein
MATVNDFSKDIVKLHPIQRAGPNLVRPNLDGSIILWAVDEIKAARATLGASHDH